MKKIDVPVIFNDKTCFAHIGRYRDNNRLAIEIRSKSNVPLIVASSNVPQVELLEDEIILKNYSENEGIYFALIAADIVKPTFKSVRMNYVDMPIVKLLHSVN